MADARMTRLRRIPVDDWTDDDLRYAQVYREEARERRAEARERREELEQEALDAEQEEHERQEAQAAREARYRERYGFLDTAGTRTAARSGRAFQAVAPGDRAWMEQAADAISGRQLQRERRATQQYAANRAAARQQPPLRPGERALLHMGVLNGIPGAAERLAAFDTDSED